MIQIRKLIETIASEMKMPLAKIILVEGQELGCIDANLLKITASDKQISLLVYQAEMDDIYNGSRCEQLEYKIKSALSQLQLSLES